MSKAKKRTKKDEDNGDIEFMEDEERPGASFGGDSEVLIKKLKEKLKTCQKERQEYLDGWQRAKADFVNARKEEEKTRGEFVKFVKIDLLIQLLSVVDSFESAFSNKTWEKIDKGWRAGVEHIHSQLLGILKENGLVQVNPSGEAFDPTLHESVELVATTKKEESGKIIEVVQKGYTLNGKIIRPARVKVGEYRIQK